MEIYLKVKEFETVRMKRGFTKNYTAEFIGIARNTLENWYKNRPVSPKNAKMATDKLCMTFDDLFEIKEVEK